MKKLTITAFALAICSGLYAQTYTPVALTGFTADVIANGSGPAAASTTNDVDASGYAFVAQDFVNPAGQSAAGVTLPNSGTITSAVTSPPGLTFQLEPYTANNSLRRSAIGRDTLTFITPRPASKLYVLATSGSASSTVDINVNFTDGTFEAFPGIIVANWYAGSNSAFNGTSRVNRSTSVTDLQTGGPRLYQKLLTLSAANFGKPIRSISFNKTTTTGVLNVMGVTILPSSVSGTDAGKNDGDMDLAIAVQPNPSTGIFQISLPKGTGFELTVTELTGKVIKKQKVTSKTTMLDLHTEAKGIYILKLESKGKTAMRKVVVE